jgi:hypothetical protein
MGRSSVCKDCCQICVDQAVKSFGYDNIIAWIRPSSPEEPRQYHGISLIVSQ